MEHPDNADASASDVLDGIDPDNVVSARKYSLCSSFATFDIETTSLEERGFMYHWQMCIDDRVVFGRYWEEYINLISEISIHFALHPDHKRFVVYVHFLPFEFQFMRNFFHWESVFATDINSPVKCIDSYGIEYRCSYKLSNMSLAKFTLNYGARHNKQSGDDYNYTLRRYPWTVLTPENKYYCYCDVKGQHEALEKMLEEDTLVTIPLTSTGYVRREARKAMHSNKKNIFLLRDTALDSFEYALCRTARRGGDTGSNPTLVNQWLSGVDSWDRQSAYPYEMLCSRYPMTPFIDVSDREAIELVHDSDTAVIMCVSFENIRVKDMFGVPYIPVAKCTEKYNIVNCNGRVLKADRVTLCVTDVDMLLIEEDYIWEEMFVTNAGISEYDFLPIEYRKTVLHYFEEKTKLKGVDDYLYMKSKNKLNALFGMMLTDMCHPEIILLDHAVEERGRLRAWDKVQGDVEKDLKAYYASYSSFLPYQWGLWVTAWARYHLRDPIRDPVNRKRSIYRDTDSHKMDLGYNKDIFEECNKRIRAAADSYDVKPYVDHNGKRYYLGEWEYEDTYQQFKTLGAKKYCMVSSKGEVEVTVSGLNKKQAGRYLEKIGLDHFDIGTVFPFRDVDGDKVSGRTYSIFNHVDRPFYEKIGKRKFLTGSSIAIHETSYTLGMTPQYLELQEAIQKYGYQAIGDF